MRATQSRSEHLKPVTSSMCWSHGLTSRDSSVFGLCIATAGRAGHPLFRRQGRLSWSHSQMLHRQLLGAGRTPPPAVAGLMLSCILLGDLAFEATTGASSELAGTFGLALLGGVDGRPAATPGHLHEFFQSVRVQAHSWKRLIQEALSANF